eukprot:CAMPEP_0116824702 /NCGR_PEP_ID=MMETSP0418-20121206/1543_1 /TAXON_ID=1158023 /ORGANISM="Astrosyne radiata, Strain 13vi08-1A" /LENGTH=136 /DNA_ID=CAMNT_0004453101 /DNA_START=23 /DNA_END=433 /DNA_ORIENTATION=+
MNDYNTNESYENYTPVVSFPLEEVTMIVELPPLDELSKSRMFYTSKEIHLFQEAAKLERQMALMRMWRSQKKRQREMDSLCCGKAVHTPDEGETQPTLPRNKRQKSFHGDKDVIMVPPSQHWLSPSKKFLPQRPLR